MHLKRNLIQEQKKLWRICALFIKSKTKKTIILTILLSGIVAYITIADKLDMHYVNTMHKNKQFTFVNNDYNLNVLENIANAFSFNQAYAKRTGKSQKFFYPKLKEDEALSNFQITKYTHIYAPGQVSKVFGPKKEIDVFTGNDVFNTDYEVDELVRDLRIRTALKKWMNQTVEETLAGAECTKVNNKTYETEIFDADKHVILMFYSNDGTYSRKLASFSRSLCERFPFKFLAWKISGRDLTQKNIENYVSSRHPADRLPSLVVYEYNNGKIRHFATAQGEYDAFKSFERFLEDLPRVMQYFKRNFFE